MLHSFALVRVREEHQEDRAYDDYINVSNESTRQRTRSSTVEAYLHDIFWQMTEKQSWTLRDLATAWESTMFHNQYVENAERSGDWGSTGSGALYRHSHTTMSNQERCV